MMAASALSWRLSLLIALLSLTVPQVSIAAKDASHISCFYNSQANVSCVWSREKGLQATACHIHAQSDQREWNETCKLFPLGPEEDSWACNLILGPPGSQKLTAADVLNISVVCWEGQRWRLVKTRAFRPFDNLRLVAPHSLQVLCVESRSCNVSWQLSHISHYLESYLESEARVRSPGQHWEDKPLLSLKQPQMWICLEALSPSTQYEIQVRVRAHRGALRTWSPWSRPLAFRTKPEDPEREPWLLPWSSQLLLGLGCVLVFLTFVYILANCRYLRPWMKTALKCHIPDPSEFFSQLSSRHGGDLQKWLSSPVPPSSFGPVGPAPEISPLEVLKRDSKATQLLLLQQDTAPSPGGHSQGSCFTNQGYFFFHLPDALEIEACQVYFTYDPCAEEDMGEAGPGLPEGSPVPPEGSPVPPLLPLAGEDDAYCTFPPGDDLMPFSPNVLHSPNPPLAALGGDALPPERLPVSSQEEALPPAPLELVDLQCLGRLALGEAKEEVLVGDPRAETNIPEVSPCQDGQGRAPTSSLATDPNIYLSLQELQAQDPGRLV